MKKSKEEVLKEVFIGFQSAYSRLLIAAEALDYQFGEQYPFHRDFLELYFKVDGWVCDEVEKLRKVGIGA